MLAEQPAIFEELPVLQAPPGNEEVAIAPNRRLSKIWLHTASLANEAEKQRFLVTEAWWKSQKTTRGRNGHSKQYFYCSSAKAKSCPAMIYLQKEGNAAAYSVFESGQHEHGGDGVQLCKLMMEYIASLVASNHKFRSISHLIREDQRFDIKPDDKQVKLCVPTFITDF